MIYASNVKQAVKAEARKLEMSTLREVRDRYGIKKHITQDFTDGVIVGLKLIDMLIDKADVNFGEWNFCDERKPQQRKEYLVTVVNPDYNAVYKTVSKWNGRGWSVKMLNPSLLVICWHEIPETYKGHKIDVLKRLNKSGADGVGVKKKDYKVYESR